mmetsp:Transcript_30344/g.66297  ORF Transcript_30344/g.66297 Transcript_30344/m.66297 type:complete len:290 (-) Transcript_30344:31-900(-)
MAVASTCVDPQLELLRVRYLGHEKLFFLQHLRCELQAHLAHPLSPACEAFAAHGVGPAARLAHHHVGVGQCVRAVARARCRLHDVVRLAEQDKRGDGDGFGAAARGRGPLQVVRALLRRLPVGLREGREGAAMQPLEEVLVGGGSQHAGHIDPPRAEHLRVLRHYALHLLDQKVLAHLRVMLLEPRPVLHPVHARVHGSGSCQQILLSRVGLDVAQDDACAGAQPHRHEGGLRIRRFQMLQHRVEVVGTAEAEGVRASEREAAEPPPHINCHVPARLQRGAGQRVRGVV